MALKLLGILFFCPFYLLSQATEPPKFALLVGISRYADSNWPTLHGKEDIETIAATLKDKGFVEDNVLQCTDEQATKEGIVAALKRLRASVSKGAIVYIHFSMHGQQVYDDDTHPKEESDDLDECLVPYDCPFVDGDSEFTYGGEKHLRDDEIGIVVDEIRTALGVKGQVLVIMDACHSGTATRSSAQQKYVKPLWFGHTHVDHSDKEKVNRISGESASDASVMAPMLAIFAALPGEEAQDMVLSSAVNEALLNARSYTNYASFFSSIVSIVKSVSSAYTPNQEGLEKLGAALLFGGTLLDPIAYFEVTKVVNSKRLVLNQGTFANLFPGTELAFYPQGTRISEITKTPPWTTGRIVSSTESEATVDIQPRPDIPVDSLKNAWAYVTKWVISDQAMPIQLDLKEIRLKNALWERLSKNNNFLMDPSAKTGVRITEEQLLLKIFDQNGTLLHEIGNTAQPEDISEDIERFLLQHQRFVTLRNLRYQNSQVGVTWNMYPSKCNKRCEPLGEAIAFSPTTNLYEMKEGDCFGIEIKNTSNHEIFFSLLDFPANQAEISSDLVMIPTPEKSPESFSINPGHTWRSYDFADSFCWQVDSNFGKETLKLITSLLPVHLREAVKTRSVTQEKEQMEGDNLFDVQDIHFLVKPRN